MNREIRHTPWLFSALCMLLMLGCANERIQKEGMSLLQSGHIEEGLEKLEALSKKQPQDANLRAQWLSQRQMAIAKLTADGDQARAAGRWEEAVSYYQRILKLEPTHQRAQRGLAAVETDQAQAQTVRDADALLQKGDVIGAEDKLRGVLTQNPNQREARILMRKVEDKQARKPVAEMDLNTVYNKPVTLEFRDANLKMVFEALSRNTNINFVMDKDVRSDLKTTIFVKQSSLDEALDLILTTNQLEKKVLNDKTVLIYPNIPTKTRDYQELAIKAFYLANADAKNVMNMIRTFIKTRDIFVEDKLNMLVMRDTPDAIRMAEKLVALQDMPEPEVMLELEVLEITGSKLTELGIKYPGQITMDLLSSKEAAADGTTTKSDATVSAAGKTLLLSDLAHITQDRVEIGGLSASLNLRRELGDANILANPRIRARNKEKAKIKIGDRVPVITTTQSTTNNTSTDNVQYIDVGLIVEMEPDIHLNDDLAVKLSLEVSQVLKEIKLTNSLAYQIGTRNVNTVLRIKDGETQILGGLIRNEDRTSSSRIPGLGDLPFLGRLFSSQRDSRDKTEIVLAITPHIINNIQRPNIEDSEFWSGTEAALRSGPIGGSPLPNSGMAPGMPGQFMPERGGMPGQPTGPTGLMPPGMRPPGFPSPQIPQGFQSFPGQFGQPAPEEPVEDNQPEDIPPDDIPPEEIPPEAQ